MAREILTELSPDKFYQLKQNKITNKSEMLKYISLELEVSDTKREIQERLLASEKEAKEIIDSALREKKNILDRARDLTLTVQKLEELSLEERQRAYWKKTIDDTSLCIEKIVYKSISSLIRNFDNKEIIKFLIEKGIEPYLNKQSFTVRVPLNMQSYVSDAFPNLLIVGEEGMRDNMEIEVDNEVFLVSIEDVISQLTQQPR